MVTGVVRHLQGAPASCAPGAPGLVHVRPARQLLNGFIKIELQRHANNATRWLEDVTLQILNLGIAGRNLSERRSLSLAAGGPLRPTLGQRHPRALPSPQPNAIIRLQRVQGRALGRRHLALRRGGAPASCGPAQADDRLLAASAVRHARRGQCATTTAPTHRGGHRDRRRHVLRRARRG